MTKNTSFEASHELITEGVVATIERSTNTTETEEDIPLFRKKLQRCWEYDSLPPQRKKIGTAAHLSISSRISYGPYWHNIRNWLHVRENCLLIDERIVIPTQLRQTVLDSLHLTHPGSAAMLDICQHVWFPHIHRTIVHMAQNCNGTR